MGYIAPIPHYQYKQYQEREIKVEKHPSDFSPSNHQTIEK